VTKTTRAILAVAKPHFFECNETDACFKMQCRWQLHHHHQQQQYPRKSPLYAEFFCLSGGRVDKKNLKCCQFAYLTLRTSEKKLKYSFTKPITEFCDVNGRGVVAQW